MPLITAIVVLFAFMACAEQPSDLATPSISVSRQDEGYMVREAGRPVLFYQLAPKSLDGKYQRSNYIHPLYGLDGEILTEDFPEDHYHHRGVFWTWHQVLIGDVRAGDPWLARRFSWQLQDAAVLSADNGVRTVHHWFSPDFAEGLEAILEERAEVSVLPEQSGVRLVDFDIHLAALQEGVRLGGSEDDKGYGGFSLRVKMLDDLSFASVAGLIEPTRLALDAGDWVDFSGSFDPGSEVTSGVAILVHPTSAGYPQKWVLRTSATPSMQNPVWPGPAPVAVPMGEVVRLRYRLAVHRGDAAQVDLDRLAQAYAAIP